MDKNIALHMGQAVWIYKLQDNVGGVCKISILPRVLDKPVENTTDDEWWLRTLGGEAIGKISSRDCYPSKLDAIKASYETLVNYRWLKSTDFLQIQVK